MESIELKTALSSLTSDTLILTANRRLARRVESVYAALRVERRSGRAWDSIQCYSLDEWWRSRWATFQQANRAAEFRLALLSDAQESRLWRDCGRELTREFELLDGERSADAAQSAWKTLRLWDLDVETLSADMAEVRLLQQWVANYRRLCRELRLSDASDAARTLVEFYCADREGAPAQLLLYGFADIAPLWQRLFKHWRDGGCSVAEISVARNARVSRRACLDIGDEIRSAARWAADCLAGNRELRVGIVVPQLAALRSRVERVFHAEFSPRQLDARFARRAPPFNISASESLASTPPIAAALNLLELNRERIDVEVLGEILHSPFFGDDAELGARSRLHTELACLAPDLRVSLLRARAAERGDLSGLHRSLQSMQAQKAPQSASASRWAQCFQLQLQALEWPAERVPDTFEYQQLQKWPEVLKRFAALDTVLSQPLSLAEALRELRRCAELPFHAETPDSPLQILGLLEAEGLEFDRLWVMNLDASRWPQPPAPNPFLPLALQVAARMPRASAAGELEYARRLTAVLQTSADEVVFSWPRAEAESQLRVSPLIRQFVEDEDVVEPLRRREGEASLLEAWDGGEPCPLAAEERVGGGAELLRDQAACGFQAFARHRLGARNPEPFGPGVSAREQGLLLHSSLDLLWKSLGKHARLCALDDGSLRREIDAAIAAAWRRLRFEREIGERWQKIESERLSSLLWRWMQLEKGRAAFSVAQREQKLALQLSGLELRLRPDRVDELADGSLLVLDYKSGDHGAREWEGERPDEPQLPLYLLAEGERVRALSFALIGAKTLGFKGVSESELNIAGIESLEAMKIAPAPSWPELVALWKEQLNALAEDFVGGAAAINPKKGASTCARCDLQGLCRVAEIGVAADGDEDEGLLS